MFESILIANRGEIAVRIIAACQEMDIRAIAVYSEADRNALHVRRADAAYFIGAAPARASYLNIEALINAAKASGATAIHPGYGFLSENADFADACTQAGIVFIGPPAEAIRLMGSKTAAKQAVQAVGVPTVPGYAGEQRDLRTMQREAGRIGFPIMIKAAAGGGGKGMRVVHNREEFAEALAAAQREALAAFGDESVFLEKLIVAPRHVEFQVLADQHGTVVHLGERDCSIQRRHQKVVEESPCIALTPQLRQEMGAAAVAAARTAGYVNAGTVEFLLDDTGKYYFLEMNTRLQVEHPVTESVTGLDLVRLQLAIAAGERLPATLEQITPRGHAIEVRLYAEDPANGYLPSTGTLRYFQPPVAPGVRVDVGVATGDEVSVHYDPMLAKLIVYGPERSAAIKRLGWALDHFAVLGIASNIPLLRAIASEADFIEGTTSTAYLDTHDLSAATQHPPTEPLALIAAALWETLVAQAATPASNGRYSPWTSQAAVSSNASRQFRYQRGPEEYRVNLTPAVNGSAYTASVNVEPFTLPLDGKQSDAAMPISASLDADHTITLAIGADRYQAAVVAAGFDLLVSYRGTTYTLSKSRPLDVDIAAHTSEHVAGRQTLTAPMAGTVIKVNVAQGDHVSAHQPLVVLSAMKMEHAITSPYPGQILRVTHAAGDVVPGGEVLIELDSSEEAKA